MLIERAQKYLTLGSNSLLQYSKHMPSACLLSNWTLGGWSLNLTSALDSLHS